MKTLFKFLLVVSCIFLLVACKANLPTKNWPMPAQQTTAISQYPPKINSFDVFPPQFTQGQSIELSWETANSSEVHISGIGKVSPSGTYKINNVQIDQTDFILTASNNGNFPPATKKLLIQRIAYSRIAPDGLNHSNPKPPIFIMGDKATLTKTINKYNYKPIARGTRIKPPVTRTNYQSPTPRPANVKVITRDHRIKNINYSKSSSLNAPHILRPKNNSKFSHFPRKLTLSWKPLKGAVAYNVEIDCFHCCASGKWCSNIGKKYKQVKKLKKTYYRFNFSGAQPGRWRVQGVDKKGKAGKLSAWNYFKFTR